MIKRNAVNAQQKVVDDSLIEKALAKAVYEGDIVNLRLLFQPFSPARPASTERLETEKYAYLLPDENMEGEYEFRELCKRIRKPDLWDFIKAELDANRPAKLPSSLILELADNAVRAGKYTMAAQAYELLRLRNWMQEVFFRQAETALDANNITKGVKGYIIATGLEYDYAAYPEPLPSVPNYQKRALALHGEYPARIEDSLPLQETEWFLRTAFTYLLYNSTAAARLESRPVEMRVAILKELVHQRDPEWAEFAERYRQACVLMREYDDQIARSIEERQGNGTESRTVVAEIEETLGADPMRLPSILLGRTIEGREWWQYLKELAYEHPAAALFVARQVVGDSETLLPRYRSDSPVPKALGLIP